MVVPTMPMGALDVGWTSNPVFDCISNCHKNKPPPLPRKRNSPAQRVPTNQEQSEESSLPINKDDEEDHDHDLTEEASATKEEASASLDDIVAVKQSQPIVQSPVESPTSSPQLEATVDQKSEESESEDSSVPLPALIGVGVGIPVLSLAAYKYMTHAYKTKVAESPIQDLKSAETPIQDLK